MLGKPAAVLALLVIASPMALAPARAQDETPPGVIGGPLVVEAGTGNAAAQIDPERAAALQAKLDEAAERLQLTDAQREQVRPILTDSLERAAAVVQAVRADGRPSLRELRGLRSDLEAIDQDAKAQLAGILSTEQLAELEVIQQENREELRARLRERAEAP